MSEVNPYAAPQSTEFVELVEDDQFYQTQIFRKGRLLVMHKRAVLPDRCVKSNGPAYKRLKRSLSWHHPAVYFTLLAHFALYLILALILSKRARIYIGISRKWLYLRRWWSFLGLILLLVGIITMITGALDIFYLPSRGWPIFFGGVIIIVASIYFLMRSQLVLPKRISDDYIWLNGVHPDYLASLPEWPYEP
ncbi:MAG: hypothetical protein JXB10_16315 [Pirellulales bacterium]|nr:hypothetical protein [Pirellulales bacterium]